MRIPAPLSKSNLDWKTFAGVVKDRPFRGVLTLGVLTTTLFLLAVGCNRGEVATVKAIPAELETIDVETIVVHQQPWPTILRSQGTLDADEQSVVGSKVSGRVGQIHVDVGDIVRQGDPLVTLEREDAMLRVVQAEAQLSQSRAAVGLTDGMSVETLDPKTSPPVREAEATWDEATNALKRSARLLSQNAIAQSEYDQADALERVASARYASALNGVREKIAMISVRQAELSMAKQQLDDTIIVSPLDGYVQQRNVAPGTFVSVGQTIASIVSTDPLRFRGTIPERYAQSLRIGQEIRLQIESVSEPRNAKITRINPTLNQQSRTLAFEAEIDNHDRVLRSGLFAEAEVEIDATAEKLVIPESALLEFAGTRKVWKVIDGVAHEKAIITGARRNGHCEVIQGLAIGEVILRNAVQGRVATVSSSSPRVNPITGRQDTDDSQPELSTTTIEKTSEPVAAGSS